MTTPKQDEMSAEQGRTRMRTKRDTGRKAAGVDDTVKDLEDLAVPTYAEVKGGDTGKVNVQDINFIKWVDKSSPSI